MARNGSGSFSVSDTFTSGSTISSAAVNAVLEDIGSEITNSLAKDGQSTMTGPIKAASGSLSAPGYAFGSDTDTGIRRSASKTFRMVANGTDVAQVDDGGITMQSGMEITDQNSVVVTGIPPGAMMMYGATSAPTGWVRCNGLTIGNASSSATERANADTSALFTFLWTNFSDGVCAVGGGRGASAAADYAANKAIALPDLRGRSFFGLDTMGNSAASRLGNQITSSTTNGASGGAEEVTLARANLPNTSVSVTVDITDPGHTHPTSKFGSTGTQLGTAGGGLNNAVATSSATTGITASGSFNLNGSVSQTNVNNMPPAFLTTFIIKL